MPTPQLLSHALVSLVKKGNVVRFSGFARKTNHLSSLARTKRVPD
ncbi:MAG: hypothetical protein U5L45_22690 [Saprospiraceae bacterium]|nr:hypothetical protein [Saprospiraceae bacterium]